MNLSNYFNPTTSFQPGIPCSAAEQDDPVTSNSSLKKRKRDHVSPDAISVNRNTKFMPSSISHLNSPILVQYAELPREPAEPSHRPRSFARKRRVLQQPYHQTQHPPSYLHNQLQPFQPNPAQAKLLSPNLCVTTASDTSSPPISPKTLVPTPYPLQQNYCTSASCLRPCHICHRRPTTREVLDAYADCDLCGERSCYICLRQCDDLDCVGSINPIVEMTLSTDQPDAPQGSMDDDGARQRRKICSCCAVEGMTEEGIEIVRCLDCMRNHVSTWQNIHSGQ
ncbi:hypothetical protein BDV59DRAFT_196905 [Aspergillus ambiguus]|uniref:uncharacterized protein n=1 Tax=Aspergillus ambiguus TaxID=176160 RepID=UPI003CCD48FF